MTRVGQSIIIPENPVIKKYKNQFVDVYSISKIPEFVATVVNRDNPKWKSDSIAQGYARNLKKAKLDLGPVINAKEQRKGVLSILELTSLDDTNSQVCPVLHLSTYLRASKGRRKSHSGDSLFIQNEEINIIVLPTLSSSGIDISKFKSHSTRSAMASLLLSNNVPFHIVKKMSRWKSNDTYKYMVNNQGLLIEEECILKKDKISELNKVFNFPSNFQVDVAPFGTPEGISESSTIKNNDTDLMIVKKRINDSLKPLFLISSTSHVMYFII
ncbi:hypothetical protein ACTFIW_003774 [Dictyostelium discoideum]